LTLGQAQLGAEVGIICDSNTAGDAVALGRLSRLYNVDSSGSVASPLIGPIRARASPPRSSPTTSPMS
jgi:hypothetical protein